MHETCTRLLDLGVDAVICYDDRIGLHLLDAMRLEGVEVPGHIAVTGFDDIPFAAIANPRLTTVAVPTSVIAREAARWLTTVDDQHAIVPAHTLFPVRLVPRESTLGA